MTPALLVAVLLFVGLLLFIEAGFRLGSPRPASAGEPAPRGAGALEGALLGLLVLWLAVSWASALARAEDRRQLLVGEASAISTAWLRLDLLPGGAQAQARDLFRQYLELRIETFRVLPDEAASKQHLELAREVQGRLWQLALATVGASPSAVELVLGSLTEMFEYPARRAAAQATRPPPLSLGLLVALALAGALLSGRSMAAGRARQWLPAVLFAALVSASLYVSLDLDFPRPGLARVDGADQPLVDVRRAMK